MAAPIAKYIKTPAERKRYTINYSDWLDTGITVASVEFDSEGTLVIDDDAINGDGDIVEYFASAGDDGETYTVVVLATTSNGQIKEDHILFVVRE